MRSKLFVASALTLSLALVACGDDSGSSNNGDGSAGSAITERSGPESLDGFEWTMEPVVVNGIQLQMAFEFTDDEVILSNTCDGATTVSTSSPIRYTYSGTVPQGDSTRVGDDDNFCEVEIKATEFDFELVGGNLQISDGTETLLASPAGSVSGLYGTWKVVSEFITLTFRMGNGKLFAKSECDNGLSADVSVDATYKNFIVIEEDSSTEENGCSASITASTFEYWFEGDTLVMKMDGQVARLEK